MTSPVLVRSASPADVATLVPLVRRYRELEHISGFDEARVSAALAQQLADRRVADGWIALADDRAVGYLLAVYVFSLEHLGLTAEIDELYIVPGHRGSGVGTALLQTAERAMAAAGCTNVSLQLGRGNDSARMFYRRHGYAARDGYELLDKPLSTGGS